MYLVPGKRCKDFQRRTGFYQCIPLVFEEVIGFGVSASEEEQVLGWGDARVTKLFAPLHTLVNK
jgi:hypothetical protein